MLRSFSPPPGRLRDGARHFAQGFVAGVVEITAVENVVRRFRIGFLGVARLMGESAARTDPGKARAVEDGGRSRDIVAHPNEEVVGVDLVACELDGARQHASSEALACALHDQQRPPRLALLWRKREEGLAERFQLYGRSALGVLGVSTPLPRPARASRPGREATAMAGTGRASRNRACR